jgi:hypothetical protein
MSIEPTRGGAGERASESNLKIDLTARLDRLPKGRFHTVVTIALGVGWTLAAFQTNIIGNILGQIAPLRDLSPAQSRH